MHDPKRKKSPRETWGIFVFERRLDLCFGFG